MAPITSANKHQTHYLIANGNFTTEVNNKMANLCYKIISLWVAGPEHLLMPQPVADVVEVNCAPRPAPHMQTQPHPCSNPLLLAAFPLLFPVALGHPVAMHSLPSTHTLRANLHLHLHLLLFYLFCRRQPSTRHRR